MRILPNGKVEIQNFETKEVRQISPEELPNYGISYQVYSDLKKQTMENAPVPAPDGTSNTNFPPPVTATAPAYQTGTQTTTTQNGSLYDAFEDVPDTANSSAGFNPEAQVKSESWLGNLTKNAGNDLYSIVNGVLNIPSAVKEGVIARIKEGKPIDPMSLGVAGGHTILKGAINEYNELLGRPMEGGDVLGRIGQRAYEKPVSTVLDVLPFIGPLKKLATGSKASKVTSLPTISKTTKPNILQKTGKSLKQEAAPIYEKPSVYGAGKEAAIRKTLDDAGIHGTPNQQYTALEPAMNKLSTKIAKKLAENPQAVSYKGIVAKFNENLASLKRTKVLTNSQAINETKGYLKDLGNLKEGDIITTQKLFDLKKIVNEDYGAVKAKMDRGMPLTPREQVVSAARKTLDDVITDLHPEVKELTLKQSKLYDAAPSLSKARKTVPTERVFGTTIPAGVKSTALDLTGRIAENVGDKVAGASAGLKQIPSKISGVTEKAGILPPIIASQRSTKNGQNEANYPADYPKQDTSQQQTKTNLETKEDHILPSITQKPTYVTGYSPEQWLQERQRALNEGNTKQADSYYESYKIEADYQAKINPPEKIRTPITESQAVMVKSAKRNIDYAKKYLGMVDTQGNPTGKINIGVSRKRFLSGDWLTPGYAAAAGKVVEAIVRIESGAQVPESERQHYIYNWFPNIKDTPESAQQKMDDLDARMADYGIE